MAFNRLRKRPWRSLLQLLARANRSIGAITLMKEPLLKIKPMGINHAMGSLELHAQLPLLTGLNHGYAL